MADGAGQVATWLADASGRLRRRGDAVRLQLAAAESPALAAPAAWAGAAAALERAAGPAARLEVSVPESADPLINVAVNELVKQGLRFLHLEYERNGTGEAAFVAVFLPAGGPGAAPPAAYVLRQDATGQQWELAPEKRLLIGRDAACDVPVASPRASGQHCAVHFARRAFALVDLGSSAGTFLDNLPLRRGVVEEFGRICLGRKETGHYLEMELRVPAGGEAFLHVISGANSGQSIPLQRPVLTVGRAPHCDLQIDAPYISREHLRLALLADCYLVSDLASTNGIVHNGSPVPSGHLVPGDRIEVGDERFTFASRPGLEGFYVPGWRVRALGQEVTLDRPYTSVGREPGSDFLAGTAGLSRRHARLVWERPGRLHVYDLASSSGTTVAGQLIARAELHGGEALTFGPVQARVVAPE
jgi:pSer/pThr/pTyr-binding forkhead associated (FHA) protein